MNMQINLAPVLTKTMSKALLILHLNDGDLPWDFEDTMGLYGAVFWGVLDALKRRGMVIDMDDGRIVPTDKGLAFLVRQRLERDPTS